MFFVFFKQKTAYELRISDWSSDVCSSDVAAVLGLEGRHHQPGASWRDRGRDPRRAAGGRAGGRTSAHGRGARGGGAAADKLYRRINYIIPAKAGIQGARRLIQSWVPAFAGMTKLLEFRPHQRRAVDHRLPLGLRMREIGRAHV